MLQGYGGVLLDFGKTFGHDPLEVLLLMFFFSEKTTVLMRLQNEPLTFRDGFYYKNLGVDKTNNFLRDKT